MFKESFPQEKKKWGKMYLVGFQKSKNNFEVYSFINILYIKVHS